MKTQYIICLLIVIVIIGAGVLLATNPSEIPNEGTPQEVVWTTYTNDKYAFELQYPQGWKVFEGDQFGTPVINVYKESETEAPPFIHHTNVTNVSIFPDGVPTEGVRGETATSTVPFQEPVQQAIDFLLQDGKRWATYAGFTNNPEPWQPWGFVWSRVEIENPATVCVQNSVERPIEECDLGIESEGAQVIWSGTIAEDDRETQEKILASFKFLR